MPRCATQEAPHDTASNGAVHISPAELALLKEKAAGLINPASGLANDYLNHFNEILLLIENLPVLLPDMVDEILTWQPKSYHQYFHDSPLPGGDAALTIYSTLDVTFRNDFEDIIETVNALALKSVDIIVRKRDENGDINSDDVTKYCETVAITMRSLLTRAENMVNYGESYPVEAPQQTADRLLKAGADL